MTPSWYQKSLTWGILKAPRVILINNKVWEPQGQDKSFALCFNAPHHKDKLFYGNCMLCVHVCASMYIRTGVHMNAATHQADRQMRGLDLSGNKKMKKVLRTTEMYQAAFSLVQSLSHVQLFVTPWTAACQASLSITNSWSLLKLMSIKLVMPSNRLILCCPLLFPPIIFPSIRVFSKESVLPIRWPQYWSFSFSISSSNEYSGLIPFRMDWFDLLAVQGTLRSLLQHHSSKASVLWHSTFFIHYYVSYRGTTWWFTIFKS